MRDRDRGRYCEREIEIEIDREGDLNKETEIGRVRETKKGEKQSQI